MAVVLVQAQAGHNQVKKIKKKSSAALCGCRLQGRAGQVLGLGGCSYLSQRNQPGLAVPACACLPAPSLPSLAPLLPLYFTSGGFSGLQSSPSPPLKCSRLPDFVARLRRESLPQPAHHRPSPSSSATTVLPSLPPSLVQQGARVAIRRRRLTTFRASQCYTCDPQPGESANALVKALRSTFTHSLRRACPSPHCCHPLPVLIGIGRQLHVRKRAHYYYVALRLHLHLYRPSALATSSYSNLSRPRPACVRAVETFRAEKRPDERLIIRHARRS